jgi:hypothetical protein
MPIIGTLEQTAGGQVGVTRWSFAAADTWEEITVPDGANTAVIRPYDSADPAVTSTNYTLYVGFGDTAGLVGATDAWFPVTTNGNLVLDLAMSFRGGGVSGGRPKLRMAASNTACQVAIIWEQKVR